MNDALVEAVRISLTPHFSSAQCAYGDDLEAARAALAAIAEEGFVIVPKEPSHEILSAMRSRVVVHYGYALSEVYAAMLAARPKQEDKG